MKIAIALLLTISALSMWVCAAGNFRHTYALDAVQNVRLDAYGHISVAQGDTNQLDVIAGEDVTPHLELALEDDLLVITDTRTRSTWYKTKQWWQQALGGNQVQQDIHYRLTLKQPKALTLNGYFAARIADIDEPALTITFNGLGKLDVNKLTASNLAITVNGKIDVQADEIHGQSMRLVANGAGLVRADGLHLNTLQGALKGQVNCKLSGQATHVQWHMDGDGECTATGLRANDAQLHVAGSARMTVKVKRHLDAKTADQGRINYYGQPKAKTQGMRINAIAGGYQARIYY
ncbi:DUF2807 domain-containing protein [Simiduia sp. 21SJ11W-1]|uniref:GIN domain-containing protein n=1 Tax=Simiduia sp. 21SJ11W-1 TaxID=2909669 RepID=UPI0020A1BC19|nr:DUF2807 domain-containing protein [Simiduia sp. 21SJ11W-1]UTA49044.1 DUF2807 domain-containing protein [Simiduia sp. 21SJ11W-1]